MVRAAGPLVGTHAALLAVYDLASRPGLTLVFLVLSFGAWWWAARRVETWNGSAGLLGVAILLRLLLLPLPPSLSDDTLRYVWDGRVVSAGFDPYRLAPESETLSPLRDELWQRMPHKHVPTVYPPLALGFFTLASQLPIPLLAVKALLTLAELAGCWLLIRLARRLGLPAGRTVWYAWNPLAVMEVAGMGHVDALLVAGSVAAVLLLLRPADGRGAWSAVGAAAAAAGGVLGKLLPVIALPMWARQSGRPLVFLATAGAILAAALLPVAIASGGVPPGLTTYGVSWEWNGPLYEPLWRVIDTAGLVPQIKAGLDWLEATSGDYQALDPVYPLVYPQLLAKLILLGMLGCFVLASLWQRHPVLGSGRLFAGLMLSMATLYPWYLLVLLPWAALCRQRAWLALSALVQLAYVPQLFGLSYWPWFYLAIWGPFFLLLARERWSIDGEAAR